MSIIMRKEKVTLINEMQKSFYSALRTPEGVAPPVALLWTDADGQWQPLIPALQAAIPELFQLGDYAPQRRQGPAIWLRCVVDRVLPEILPPDNIVPILYLPKVSRQILRAGGDCPQALQALIELQYRGAVWHQRNGKDWTVEAFLTSVDTLGLDVATDQRTKEAMLRALPLLAGEPITALKDRKLEAEDFDKLAVGDSLRDLLMWLADAEGYRARCEGTKWATFRNICRNEFKFDPEEEIPCKVGDLLLTGGGAWDKVWQRFCEAPSLYAGVEQVLREACPQDLTADPARQPSLNTEHEEQLRSSLREVVDLPHDKACTRIIALEAQHGARRNWVWTQLGKSPLAELLEPLVRLARSSQKPLGGASLQDMTNAYASGGWRCDEAALDVLAGASTADKDLATKLLCAVYVPWLEQSARNFQTLAAKDANAFRAAAIGVTPEAETCILFADGLRFDVAEKLLAMLESRGCVVSISHRLAPVPSVTATAKPIASPAHIACESPETYNDLAPDLEAKPGNAKRLRDEMVRQGIVVLESSESAFPLGAERGAWTEFGNLDKNGHSRGLDIAKLIQGEVEALTERALELLNAGWSRVRIVTDHGWLLVPGGMPKVDLPTFLTQTKWARCAVAPGKVPDGMPVFPWHWNSTVQVVSPPGVAAFWAGNFYAHGGVSPQECVVPELLVHQGVSAIRARITDVSWRRMRCRVTVETNGSGIKVDIRLKPKQAATSIVGGAKEFNEGMQVSMVVQDDKHEGAAAMLVVLNAGGQVIDQKATQVGEDT